MVVWQILLSFWGIILTSDLLLIRFCECKTRNFQNIARQSLFVTIFTNSRRICYQAILWIFFYLTLTSLRVVITKFKCSVTSFLYILWLSPVIDTMFFIFIFQHYFTSNFVMLILYWDLLLNFWRVVGWRITFFVFERRLSLVLACHRLFLLQR